MNDGNKYILRESELKEIIKEMILCEVENAAQRKGGAYFSSVDGYTPETMPRIRDYVSTVNRTVKGGFKGLLSALGVDDNAIQRIENGDNDLLQWIIGSLGLNTAGHAGPDYVGDVASAKWAGGQGWGKGNNPDAHEVFNPAAAARHLLTNATPRYDRRRNGNCARAVRQALNYGGLSCPWGMNTFAMNAAGYLRILPANGWVEIPASQAGQVGDIVVVGAYRGHRHGHIAMNCGGNQWVADYRHSPGNVTGLRGTPPPSTVHFFRYKNIAQ